MRLKKTFLFLMMAFASFSVYAQSAGAAATINIQALSGLQFDIVRFAVKPGAKVTISFTNMDDMSHNFLITKPGARLDVVNQALKLEEKGPQLNYIPHSPNVLWSLPVLSPNQTSALSFTAPSEPGAYPYVCTYPGHGFIMYGVMYVLLEGKMPPMKEDLNIPPSRREDKDPEEPVKAAAHGDHHAGNVAADHPYELVAPYLYRTFMEDASPASIAVRLPQDLSYCWDAGTCRLLYAWSGGFVDNSLLWKGHKDGNSKLLGSVFYRDQSNYPLIIGDSKGLPEVEYKGYRLVNRYPEFHYTVNGTHVYESIKPKDDGTGLIRTFRIPDVKKGVEFFSNPGDRSTQMISSAGKWVNGTLKLTPREAQLFSVTMTSYPLVYARKTK